MKKHIKIAKKILNKEINIRYQILLFPKPKNEQKPDHIYENIDLETF
jgi:hypothetical protein